MSNTRSIAIVGVGGQGTVLTSDILIEGLVDLGFDVKKTEQHGLSQRGGSSGASLSGPSPATATVRTRKTITVLLSIRLRRRWCGASSPCLKTEWVRSALPSN